jgi:acyl dehydratase
MMSAHPLPKLIELEVGQVIGTTEFLLTRDSLVRYAGASGDFNPIHYRDDIAAAVGLPGVLAHGMLTMGAAVQVAVDWVGDAGRVIDYQVRFTKPVVVAPRGGAVVIVTGQIGSIDTDANTVRIDLEAIFEDTKVLGKAQAVVRL